MTTELLTSFRRSLGSAAAGVLLLLPALMETGCASGVDPRSPATVSRVRDSAILLGVPEHSTYSSATAVGERLVLTTRHSTGSLIKGSPLWNHRSGVFRADPLASGSGEIPCDDDMESVEHFLERSTRDWCLVRVPDSVVGEDVADAGLDLNTISFVKLRPGDTVLAGGHFLTLSELDSIRRGATFRLGYGEVIECTPDGLIHYRWLGGDPISSGCSGGPIFALVDGEPILVGSTIGEYTRFLSRTVEVGLCIPEEVLGILANDRAP